jgi:hypothetical protein
MIPRRNTERSTNAVSLRRENIRLAMNRSDLLSFMREHRLGIQASVSPTGEVQAAVVGIAVSERFEVIFDTIETSRKVHNLRRNPSIALVIGGILLGDERTVQYEGTADEPDGPELGRLKELYFASLPDGPERESWPGITYVRARPTWIRYSDFNARPPEIFEFDASQLG